MPTEEEWREQGRMVRKRAKDSPILQALADILDPPGHDALVKSTGDDELDRLMREQGVTPL